MSKYVSSHIWSLIAALIAVNSLHADDAATYELRYRYAAGQFLHYEVSDRAELTTQTANNLSKAIQQTQCLKTYRVLSTDEDGGATLEPVIESVRMSSQTGDKPAIGYDSSKDQAVPQGFESLAGTIGRPLARFQFTAHGKMVKVTLLVKDVPKKFSDAAQKTDPSINFLVTFPDKPIKVGEKWSEKLETQASVGNNLFQTLPLIRVYELAKVENDIATVKFRTSLRSPTQDPEILRQVAQQTPSGTIEFDLKEGRLITRSLLIDEKVIGAFGSQTMLQAQGEMFEKLTPPRTAAAGASTTDLEQK